MATIKSYTDIEQSLKLAEILPLESADMFCADVFDKEKELHSYNFHILSTWGCKNFDELKERENKFVQFIPCWSLAALLKYLSEIKRQVYTPILFPSEGKWTLQFAEYGHGNVCEVSCDNPVDACVAMIEKLHELNLL